MTFPVGRIERKLRKATDNRIGGSAPVYAAAVLEYLVGEILDLAGDQAIMQKKKRINARHVSMAVRGDEDLDTFVGRSTVIRGGGVVPFIHKALVPVSKKKKKSADATVSKPPSVAPELAAVSNE